jgi:nucleoside-diphosphate-sugar epimerase
MRVFVTGASGWIGSAVMPELLASGHQVLGLARSAASAKSVSVYGAEVLRGDLDDLSVLREGAAACDGVIHLAFKHDFSHMADAIESDRRALEALGTELQRTGKACVIASGTPAFPGRVATERDQSDFTGPMAGRGSNARMAVGLASRGVRSSVVRLPRSVHGEGERHGFIPQLIELARSQGIAGYVGDGSNRWPAVHVLDAAHLFCLA